jgi:hypothetical protein
VQTFYVARHSRTQVLKYHGAQMSNLSLVGKRALISESEPAAYTRKKYRTSTADAANGDIPFGWAVIVFSGHEEVAVKASSPEALKWVRANPPRKRTQFSP